MVSENPLDANEIIQTRKEIAMFNYKEEKSICSNKYDGVYTERTVEIFDGAARVGYIVEKTGSDGKPIPVEHWKKETPCEYGAFEVTGRYVRHDCIGYCVNVADGKRKFAAWYAENGKTKNRKTDVRALPASPDAEFFPTPSALAGRMARYIDWNKVETILEPSAGKGDLIRFVTKCAQRKMKNWRDDFWQENTDCIEIDENLQMILRGNGYRVVSDDFLKFSAFKHYDLIVMNPPFSNGDEHLLKAISIQSTGGGQIVCLLNAETIRNPYTNRRKFLAQKLIEHEAKIEFVQNAFTRAERPSDVEVAIVYLNMPKPPVRSNIMDGLRRAQEQAASEETGEPNALVGGDWIDRLVSGYEFEAKLGLSLFDEYNTLAPYIMNSDSEYAHPLIQLSVNGREVEHAGTDTVNRYLRNLRYKYWDRFLSRRELTEKMTSDMQNEYHDKIRELQDYDFNRFNLRRVLMEITAQLSRGVEESIEKLFEEFSAKHSWYPECEKNIHYFNGWATNKAHKVGMKVILPINGFYAKWDGTKELEAREFGGKIADIERALNYLDCGDTECHIDPYSVANVSEHRQRTTMDFTYFTATFYKKGTCHIKFNPEAAHLIDRLNIFAARKRNWLPPDYGKKKYADMDEESRAVIDEFQGREEYEKVMRAPDKYIIAPAVSLPALTA